MLPTRVRSQQALSFSVRVIQLGVMYAVVSGQLQISVNGIELEIVKEDGIIGEMALVDHSPRAATVTALTKSIVVPITEDEFLGHVHNTPFFALQVLRVTTERLRRVSQLLS